MVVVGDIVEVVHNIRCTVSCSKKDYNLNQSEMMLQILPTAIVIVGIAIALAEVDVRKP